MKISILGHTMSAITFLTRVSFVVVIILIVIAIKLLIWIDKENADLKLGKFFSIVLKALPDEDLNSIIINGKFLKMYKHRQKDVWRIIEEIVEFGEKNFSDAGKEILTKTVALFMKEINLPFKPPHALSIKAAMDMRTYEMFRHYMLFSFENKSLKKMNIWVSVLDSILFLPSIMFLYSPSKFFLMLNICSVIASIYFYQLFHRRNTPFSIAYVALHWIMVLLITAISPYFLFRRALKNWFWWPIASMFFLAIVGLWIASKMIEKTDYEKRNRNTFISHGKIQFIFELKFLSKIRYIILWMMCIFTIFCTVLMYASIYKKLFHNTLLYCLFLSASTYLGTGYFSLDSIKLDSVESIYLLSEAIAAFLLNTFYLAYIANLMFSQKSK